MVYKIGSLFTPLLCGLYFSTFQTGKLWHGKQSIKHSTWLYRWVFSGVNKQ